MEAKLIARLPLVTVELVRKRFSAAVEIHDAQAFAAELNDFMQECVELVELPAPPDAPSKTETVARGLKLKAAGLRAASSWMPGETDIQRGRASLLSVYAQPHNLALPEFAQLANKSRQQIYKDIDAGRLLTLNVGPRGQKLPDWQLDPVKQLLTQTVIQGAPGVDTWTLYHALSEPLEGLSGRSPVEVVTPETVGSVSKAVFNVLGVH